MTYKSKRTCVYEPVNPKAVTGDELYGYMTLSKDWKDGVLSIIMVPLLSFHTTKQNINSISNLERNG